MAVPERCPECGGTIVFVRETGELVCGSCGLVVSRVVAGGLVPSEVREHIVEDEFGRHHRFTDSRAVYGGVEVVTARHLTTRKVLPRLALREYAASLEEFLAPPEEGGVTVEGVFVTLRRPVTYSGWCKVHERFEDGVRRWETFRRSFPHVEVSTFKRLIGLKRVKYAVSPVDGVKAFMIACECGNKSIVYGFLTAMSEVYPELKTTPEHVGETLSRLVAEGVIASTRDTVLGETVYCILPEKRVKLVRSGRWWEVGA
ncbi:MAG: TFIIB-type zinc ribbon-containing protein [Candidatus Bathyarchaeia archaeon]